MIFEFYLVELVEITQSEKTGSIGKIFVALGNLKMALFHPSLSFSEIQYMKVYLKLLFLL